MISHSTVVEARDLAREVGERDRERRLLVEAGDLDDELHAGGRATGRAERSTPYIAGAQYPTWRARRSPGRAPGPDPAAGRRSRLSVVAACSRSSPSALGTVIGFLRVPDLSQLRLLLLPAVGPRAAARGHAVVRRLPLSDRAPAGRRLRRRAVDLRRCGRPDVVGPCWLVPGARGRRLPPGGVAVTTLVGPAAGALLFTRFDFPFLAARAYIDIPYMALVVWAAALEAARPRRGTPVLVLLAAPGSFAPRHGCSPACTGCGASCPPPGRSASPTRSSPAPRP